MLNINSHLLREGKQSGSKESSCQEGSIGVLDYAKIYVKIQGEKLKISHAQKDICFKITS